MSKYPHMGNLHINDELLERLQTLAAAQHTSVETLIETLLDNPNTSDSLSLGALEIAADAVVAVDDEQTIVAFNLGAQQMFGYTRGEILGRPLGTLLPTDTVSAHPSYLRRFSQAPEMSRHMAARTEVRGKHKNGDLFSIEASILKHIAPDGTMYYAAVLRDVSERKQREAREREQSAIFELLTENATDMISLHEPDGTILYISPSVRRIGGYEPEEVLGKNPYDYFHPDDIADIQTHHNASRTMSHERAITFRFRKKDGSYIWMETRTNPVLDENGDVVNLVTISRDVTQQRDYEERLRTEHDLLSRVMQTSPSSITVVDREGNIIFANKRAEDIHGTSRSDITSRTYDAPDWKHTDYDGNPFPDDEQPFVQVMRTKRPVWEVRQAIEWSDGRKVYLSINGAPILDEHGEVSKVVFTVEDYTHRKHQQDELQAALERERQLNRMKSTFVSMVSHEFRTPLAVILTSTGILRLKRHMLSSEQIFDRLQTIEKQVSHLTWLLEDVMFISKGEMVGHELKLEPVQIVDVIRTIAEQVNMAHPDHVPIELVGEGGNSNMLSDETLLQHIFGNLLANAMKYSPADAPVSLSYACDDTSFIALVSDEGIGIPEEDQKRLFDVFHRATNVGGVNGTGLGLAIVKQAVDALGGEISFESEEGVGTQFLVKLPLEPLPVPNYR